jgi:hypothetical protein
MIYAYENQAVEKIIHVKTVNEIPKINDKNKLKLELNTRGAFAASIPNFYQKTDRTSNQFVMWLVILTPWVTENIANFYKIFSLFFKFMNPNSQQFLNAPRVTNDLARLSRTLH